MTLDKTEPSFSYKKGPVYTTRRWKRPTVEQFEKWLTCFKQYIHDNSIEINVYVCGNFISKIEDTWDIDIILSHRNLWSFTKNQNLAVRDLMIYGMQLGHDEFNILIDMQCYFPNPELDNDFWFSPDEYLRRGQKIHSKKMNVFKDVYYCGEKTYEYETEKTEKIEEDLYIISFECPSDKLIERIKRGVKHVRPVMVI